MDLNKTKQKKAKQIKGEQKRYNAKLFDLSMCHLSNLTDEAQQSKTGQDEANLKQNKEKVGQKFKEEKLIISCERRKELHSIKSSQNNI